jgi:hypothetical protein
MDDLMTLLPRCRDVSRLIAIGELDAAPWPVRLAARWHLLICDSCRRYRRQLILIAEAARTWADGLLRDGDEAAFEAKLIQRLSK